MDLKRIKNNGDIYLSYHELVIHESYAVFIWIALDKKNYCYSLQGTIQDNLNTVVCKASVNWYY